jgi:hypothetical protein
METTIAAIRIQKRVKKWLKTKRNKKDKTVC